MVVTFGGGARDKETFAAEGQENIPHLIRELIPQATFFTQVVNRGILGHYVANASIATGVYERFDNFAHVAPENPTVFEYFRKGLRRPAQDAWVIAPSNGFNRIGQSSGALFPGGYGAEVVLPKELLASAAQREDMHPESLDFLLQDNYENPFLVSPSLHADTQLDRLQQILRISVKEIIAHAGTLSSADELSVFVMEQVMRQFSPSLLWITLHDMDVAHSGAYSLYIDAIQRTDRLCAEIWQKIESHPEYKGRTTLVILPDFGRDSDFDGAGNGFQHHRTGDALSRTTWIMALGPGIRENFTVDRPVESVDLVPTIGSWMGFETPYAKGRPVTEIL
uniref:Metalloenzyme domain-containing protein n=1 Tax=Paracidobacterium acidisoli TaxID=2303751 RepID=A0A372IK06_9BACT